MMATTILEVPDPGSRSDQVPEISGDCEAHPWPRLRAFALNVGDELDDHWPDACNVVEDPRGHVVDIGYKRADHVRGGLKADLRDVRVHLAFGVLKLTEI